MSKQLGWAESQSVNAAAELDDLETLCRRLSIEFKGFETMVCCHATMLRGFGPIGLDYVCCRSCGKLLANVASPRVNGGVDHDARFINRNGRRTWMLAGKWEANAN